MPTTPSSGPGRPLRVLFAENDVGVIGGSTRALESLVRHIDRDRFQPIVTFSRRSPNPMLPAFEALGCEVVQFGPRQRSAPETPRVLTRFLRSVSRARIDVVRCALLVRAIRRLDVDLVHANNNLRVSRWAIWAATLSRVPLVCHQRFLFRGGLVDRLGGRLVARLLCISALVRDSLGDQVPVATVRVVYDGVEVPADRPARTFVSEEPRIGIVGRLVDWKGQHLLLEAAPRVLECIPTARFVLVGGSPADGNDGYERRLRKLARDLDIVEAVDFEGSVLDVERRMREELDVVVHASTLPEPFGLVVAEAMAAACPVIAGDVGAPREIIEDGRSGLLFRAGDAEDLAAKILRALTEPGLAERLSEGAWRRVTERFDVRRTAAEVMEIWAELLETEEP